MTDKQTDKIGESASPQADQMDELEQRFTAEDPRYPARKAASEALHAYVTEWIEDYELDDGEHRPHSPSEVERFLIFDAFHGLTGDDEYQRLDEAWRSLCGPVAAVAAASPAPTPTPEPGPMATALQFHPFPLVQPRGGKPLLLITSSKVFRLGDLYGGKQWRIDGDPGWNGKEYEYALKSLSDVIFWAELPDAVALANATAIAIAKATETISVRFDVLYAFAEKHRLDFNDVCRTVRDAIAEGSRAARAVLAAAPPTPPDAARQMGAKGGPASESERLAFEAWMAGHCWALCATWDGTGYRSDSEQGGEVDPRAMATRGKWAAWRDRAALASLPPAEPAWEWVSVEERMPEPDTECLVWGPSCFDGQPYMRIDAWTEQHEAPVSFSTVTVPVGLGWNDSEFESVTHWAPLPSPPVNAGRSIPPAAPKETTK